MSASDDNLNAQTSDSRQEAAALRARLVGGLIASGVLHTPEVERALRTVPRHLFLPGVSLPDAYADNAVPTRWEDGVAVSSASQPAIVAIMLEQLQVASGMRILEIGAGTGYNAALLAELTGPSGSVITLDIDPGVTAEAVAHLAVAGYAQVRALAADGAAGWPEGAPYDRIILTVGVSDFTPAWFDQLADEGLIVAPLWLGGSEASVAFRKRDGMLDSESLAPCGFMRLRGQEAGAERWIALPGDRKLFAEHAAELAEPIARLLATRPRRRFWSRPPAPFLQYLALGGYRVVSLHHTSTPGSRRRPQARWGVFVTGSDGPSLVLFAGHLPMLLAFGGVGAEQAIEAAAARWQPDRYSPYEQWQITAHPVATAGEPPAGGVRLTRRHFVFDIRSDVSLSPG
jgi:protein-L-isoaspartate(D-aspartate) O-methyltransferase